MTFFFTMKILRFLRPSLGYLGQHLSTESLWNILCARQTVFESVLKPIDQGNQVGTERISETRYRRQIVARTSPQDKTKPEITKREFFKKKNLDVTLERSSRMWQVHLPLFSEVSKEKKWKAATHAKRRQARILFHSFRGNPEEVRVFLSCQQKF